MSLLSVVLSPSFCLCSLLLFLLPSALFADGFSSSGQRGGLTTTRERPETQQLKKSIFSMTPKCPQKSYAVINRIRKYLCSNFVRNWTSDQLIRTTLRIRKCVIRTHFKRGTVLAPVCNSKKCPLSLCLCSRLTPPPLQLFWPGWSFSKHPKSRGRLLLNL